MNYLKKNLNYFRSLGLTPYQFEKETGVRQSVISNFLSSKRKSINVDTLLKIYPVIKNYFGFTLDDILLEDLSDN